MSHPPCQGDPDLMRRRRQLKCTANSYTDREHVPPQAPPSLMVEVFLPPLVSPSLMKDAGFFLVHSPSSLAHPMRAPPTSVVYPTSGSFCRRTTRFPSPGTSLHQSAQDQGPPGVRHGCPAAPQGSHSNDTTWLLSFLCASLARGFPHLTPPVTYSGKDEVLPHLPDQAQRAQTCPRPPSQKLAEWKVDPDVSPSRWMSMTYPWQVRAPKAFLLTHGEPLSHHITLRLTQRGKLRLREIRCCPEATQAETTPALRLSDSQSPSSGIWSTTKQRLRGQRAKSYGEPSVRKGSGEAGLGRGEGTIRPPRQPKGEPLPQRLPVRGTPQ